MTRDNLMRAFRLMKIRVGSTGSNNILVHCPFGEWRHGTGGDRNASCSVKVVDAGDSTYMCWACKERGTIRVLAERMVRWGELDQAAADQVKSLESKITGYAWVPKAGVSRSKLWVAPRPEDYGGAWQELAQQVSWGVVPQYILDRGITLETCAEWGIGYDEHPNPRYPNKGARVVFRIWDDAGHEVGIDGRTLDPDPGPGSYKYWAYPGTKKSSTLYGAQLLDAAPTPRRIAVVEGFVLVLLSWQRRDPFLTLGAMGSTVSEAQARQLAWWGDEIVFMLDDDPAGIKGARDGAAAVARLAPDMNIRIAGPYPGGQTKPKRLSAEEFHAAFEAAAPYRRQGPGVGVVSQVLS